MAAINDQIRFEGISARELVKEYPQLGITTQNFYTHKAHIDIDGSKANYNRVLDKRKESKETELTKEPYPIDGDNNPISMKAMTQNLEMLGSTGDRRVDTALILDDIIACLPNVLDSVTVKDVIAAAKLKHEIFGDIGKADEGGRVEIKMNVLLQQVATEANKQGVTQEDIDLAIDMEEYEEPEE